MQIKKGDLTNFIKNIQQKSIDSTMKRSGPALKTKGSASSATNINLDGLRSHVLSIQADVKLLQTKMTFNQAQISFLQDVSSQEGEQPNQSNWKGQLADFIQKYFQNSNNVSTEKEIAETLPAAYSMRIATANEDLKNQLIKKEVQLQNILSTGLVDDGIVENSISKDLLQSAELFSKLKTDKILNLLKS